MSLNEIFNLRNLSINLGQTNGTKKPDNKTPENNIELPGLNISVSTDDENEIKTKESKSPHNTNISFVDAGTGISLGLSFCATKESEQVLDIGMSMFRTLGNRAITANNRITIPDEPVASFLLNALAYTSQIDIKDTKDPEQRKAVMRVPHRVAEKMVDNKTKESDFTQEEKDFLWQKTGIKIQQGDSGKLQYLYYATPESQPVVLTDDQLKKMYSHILNIENDQDLFNHARESGKELNKLIDEIKNESQEKSEKEKKTEFPSNTSNSVSHENKDSSSGIFTESEEIARKKSPGNNDTNYINATVEEMKKSTKYHFKRLSEIDEGRYEKNRETANKFTETRVEAIKKETEDINKK